jgi:hypothetical protein
MAGDDKMKMLQLYLTIGACGGAIASAYLIFKATGQIETLQASINALGGILTEMGKKVIGA